MLPNCHIIFKIFNYLVSLSFFLLSLKAFSQARAIEFKNSCLIKKVNESIQTHKTQIEFTPFYTKNQKFHIAKGIDYQRNLMFIAKSKGNYASGEHHIIPLEKDCYSSNFKYQAYNSQTYPKLTDGSYNLDYEKAVVIAEIAFAKNGKVVLIPIFIDDLNNYDNTNRRLDEWYTDNTFKINVFNAYSKYFDEHALSNDAYKKLLREYQANFEKKVRIQIEQEERIAHKEKYESHKNDTVIISAPKYSLNIFDNDVKLDYDDIRLLKKDTKTIESSMDAGNGMMMHTKNTFRIMVLQLIRSDIPILDIEITERDGYFITNYQFLDDELDKKVKTLDKQNPNYFKKVVKEIFISHPIFNDKNVFDWSRLLKVKSLTAVNSIYDDVRPFVNTDESIIYFVRSNDPDNSLTFINGANNEPVFSHKLDEKMINRLKEKGLDTPENRKRLLKIEKEENIQIVKEERKKVLTSNLKRSGEKFRNDVDSYDSDILYSEKNNGKFLGVQRPDFPLNNWKSNFLIGISANGKKLYSNEHNLGNKYTFNLPNNSETAYFFEYEKKSYGFEPSGEVIEFEKMHNVFSVSFFLSLNSNAILAGFQGDDSYGKGDLYISFKQQNGKFEYPINLGPDLNTINDEGEPYLAADLQTIYFTRQINKSERKVFVSRRLDDTWKKWTKPVALPEPINMPNTLTRDPFITANGKTIYFSSNRKTGKDFDIYAVRLDDLLAPATTQIITGKIFVEGENLKDLTLRVQPLSKNPNTKKDVSYATLNSDGSFEVPFRKSESVVLTASKKGYISEVVIKTDTTSVIGELGMTKLEKGNRFILKNILFKKDEPIFITKSIHDLENLLDVLVQNPQLKILIEGHTSYVNNGSVNAESLKKWHMDLSERRAKAVKKYLIDNGINASRLQSKGYGGERPIFSNKKEITRRKNRRVEILIINN